MLSMLDSGASGPGSSPGRGDCVVFLGKTLYSHSATEVYKWVPATLMLGVTLRWTSIPSRGNRNTPSRFMLQTRDKLRPDGSRGSNADLT